MYRNGSHAWFLFPVWWVKGSSFPGGIYGLLNWKNLRLKMNLTVVCLKGFVSFRGKVYLSQHRSFHEMRCCLFVARNERLSIGAFVYRCCKVFVCEPFSYEAVISATWRLWYDYSPSPPHPMAWLFPPPLHSARKTREDDTVRRMLLRKQHTSQSTLRYHESALLIVWWSLNLPCPERKFPVVSEVCCGKMTRGCCRIAGYSWSHSAWTNTAAGKSIYVNRRIQIICWYCAQFYLVIIFNNYHALWSFLLPKTGKTNLWNYLCPKYSALWAEIINLWSYRFSSGRDSATREFHCNFFRGRWFMKKNGGKKSCDTVPLIYCIAARGSHN